MPGLRLVGGLPSDHDGHEGLRGCDTDRGPQRNPGKDCRKTAEIGEPTAPSPGRQDGCEVVLSPSRGIDAG